MSADPGSSAATHGEWIAAARRDFERVHAAGDVPRVQPGPDVRSLLANALDGYEIGAELQRGGQGVVFHALHKSTRREVAIKVVHGGPFAGLAERARFEREIRILARLRHPNIVDIHDSGEVAGCQYFVMDYIAGAALDTYVAGLRTERRAVLELFVQICGAVEAAHVRGIIHRDLKPANIRVDGTGTPHVLDFGLAKPSEDEGNLTHTGQFLGSLPWASPEQVGGDASSVDMRSDVYALGVMLYQAATGQAPYELTGSLAALIARIRETPPRPPRRVCPSIDDELETILLKCLEKEPGRRYQSAGELARDLRSYLAGEAIEAKRDSGWYLLRKYVHRRRGVLAGATSLVVLLVLSSVLAWSLYAVTRQARLHEQARMWETYVAQARAERSGDLLGRKAASLQAIRAARALRFDPLLRDEAMASLNLFDLQEGEQRTAHHPSMDGLKTLDRYACVVEPGTVEVRALPDDRCLLRFSTGELPVRIMRFSPDGRFLAAKSDQAGRIELRVVEVESGAVLLQREYAGGGGVGNTRFDASGRLAACIENAGQCAMYRLPEGAAQLQFTPPEPPTTLLVSPSGDQLALANWNNPTVTIHSAHDGTVVRELTAAGGVLALAWSPDGRWLAAGSDDRSAYVWDLETDGAPRAFAAHRAQVSALEFSHDSLTLASSAWDDQTRIWDVASGTPLTAPVLGGRLSAYSDALALIRRDGLRLWTLARPDHLRVLPLGHNRESKLAAPAAGAWAVAAGPGGVELFHWDRPGEPLELSPLPARPPLLTPDGRELYVMTEAGLLHWNLAPGGESASLAPESPPIPRSGDINLTPDGDALLACAGGAVRWLDRHSGDEVRAVQVGSGLIGPRLSADGRWLFAGNWKGAVGGGTLLDLHGVRPPRHFPGDHVVGEFGPAGLLVVADAQQVQMWSLETDCVRLRRPRLTGAGLASPLAFSPAGDLLACTDSVYQVVLLAAADGGARLRLPNPELHMVSDLCFADGGRYLLVATTSGTVETWDLAAARDTLRRLELDW